MKKHVRRSSLSVGGNPKLARSFTWVLLAVASVHISGPIAAMAGRPTAKESPKNFAARATKLYETLKDDWKCLLDRKRTCTWQQKARITGELVALVSLLAGVGTLIMRKRRVAEREKYSEEGIRRRGEELAKQWKAAVDLGDLRAIDSIIKGSPAESWEPEKSIFHYALERGDRSEVVGDVFMKGTYPLQQELTRTVANAHFPALINMVLPTYPERAKNFLEEALHRGHVGAVSAVLAHGFVVDRDVTMTTSPLRMASNLGNQAILRMLIGGDPDRLSSTLTAAAFDGNAPTMNFLLREGEVDRQILNALLFTALIYDGEPDPHTGVVSVLLERGADPTAQNARGKTPLEQAKSEGVKRLLRDAIARRAAILAISLEEQAKGVGAAAEQERDEERMRERRRQEQVETERRTGSTLLYDAVSEGNLTKVEQLLDQGYDPNVQTTNKLTPLLLVAASKPDSKLDSEKREKVVKLLLDHGADPNKEGREGVPPLHMAVFMRDNSLIDALLERGADPNKISNYTGLGYEGTALHVAVWHPNNAATVAKLLLHGAQPNIRNPRGRTPLHKAVQHADAVEALLAGGADANLFDKYGENPLDRAVSFGSPLTIERLLNAGVEPKRKQLEKLRFRIGEGIERVRSLIKGAIALREAAPLAASLEEFMLPQAERTEEHAEEQIPPDVMNLILEYFVALEATE